MAAKVAAGAVVVLVPLVAATALTDFSEDVAGLLRAATVVLLVAGLAAIGFAWVGFNWAEEVLDRAINSSSGGSAKPKDAPEERSKNGNQGEAETVSLPPWPVHVEVSWTIGLYILIIESVVLLTVVVLAV